MDIVNLICVASHCSHLHHQDLVHVCCLQWWGLALLNPHQHSPLPHTHNLGHNIQFEVDVVVVVVSVVVNGDVVVVINPMQYLTLNFRRMSICVQHNVPCSCHPVVVAFVLP